MTSRPIAVTLTVNTRAINRAMRQAARAAHGFSVAFMRPATRRKHRIRCAICSPFANPAPLPFDGHAYRRRTKHRGNRR